MKQLLTLLLLLLGTAAFANTDKNTEPKPGNETTEVTTKKTTAKAAKAQDITKPATVTQKEQRSSGTTKTCTTAEKSGFGISGYFVDFVHNSNVKLVKLLLN